MTGTGGTSNARNERQCQVQELMWISGAAAVAVVMLLLGSPFTVEQRRIAIVQDFDMPKEIGASSRTNAILIPHSPGHLSTLTQQMRNAMMEAEQTVWGADTVVEPLPRVATRG